MPSETKTSGVAPADVIRVLRQTLCRRKPVGVAASQVGLQRGGEKLGSLRRHSSCHPSRRANEDGPCRGLLGRTPYLWPICAYFGSEQSSPLSIG